MQPPPRKNNHSSHGCTNEDSRAYAHISKKHKSYSFNKHNEHLTSDDNSTVNKDYSSESSKHSANSYKVNHNDSSLNDSLFEGEFNHNNRA